MTHMWPIKSQKDGSEFRSRSKNKYVKSLDRQDVTLHTEPGKMIRRASNLMEEAASGLLIVKAWLEKFFFRACLCGGEY